MIIRHKYLNSHEADTAISYIMAIAKDKEDADSAALVFATLANAIRDNAKQNVFTTMIPFEAEIDKAILPLTPFIYEPTKEDIEILAKGIADAIDRDIVKTHKKNRLLSVAEYKKELLKTAQTLSPEYFTGTAAIKATCIPKAQGPAIDVTLNKEPILGDLLRLVIEIPGGETVKLVETYCYRGKRAESNSEGTYLFEVLT